MGKSFLVLVLAAFLVSGFIFASSLSAVNPALVNLGSSGSFAVLAKSGISTTGTTSVVGDIGVSPIDSTAMTGFGLILYSTTQFSTSSLLNGKAYASDYSPPTPSKMTTAVSDMEAAYTDAAGRSLPDSTELGAGNIGGLTLAPGLYKWGTGVTIPTALTLSGSSNGVWIFQIGQDLDLGNGVAIVLSGGALAQNVFWQVAGQATLGTTSQFKGIILSQNEIVIKTGAKLDGRALAQKAVTLDAATITSPNSISSSSSTSGTSPSSTQGQATSSSWTSTGTQGQATSSPLPTITPNPVIYQDERRIVPTAPKGSYPPSYPPWHGMATIGPVSKSNYPVTTVSPSLEASNGYQENPSANPSAQTPMASISPSVNAEASAQALEQNKITEAELNSPTVAIATALVILLAAGGLFYYFRVMKK